MIPINPSGSSFDANETLGAGRDPHDSETTHPVDEAEHPVHPDEARSEERRVGKEGRSRGAPKR